MMTDYRPKKAQIYEVDNSTEILSNEEKLQALKQAEKGSRIKTRTFSYSERLKRHFQVNQIVKQRNKAK